MTAQELEALSRRPPSSPAEASTPSVARPAATVQSERAVHAKLDHRHWGKALVNHPAVFGSIWSCVAPDHRSSRRGKKRKPKCRKKVSPPPPGTSLGFMNTVRSRINRRGVRRNVRLEKTAPCSSARGSPLANSPPKQLCARCDRQSRFVNTTTCLTKRFGSSNLSCLFFQ